MSNFSFPPRRPPVSVSRRNKGWTGFIILLQILTILFVFWTWRYPMSTAALPSQATEEVEITEPPLQTEEPIATEKPAVTLKPAVTEEPPATETPLPVKNLLIETPPAFIEMFLDGQYKVPLSLRILQENQPYSGTLTLSIEPVDFATIDGKSSGEYNIVDGKLDLILQSGTTSAPEASLIISSQNTEIQKIPLTQIQKSTSTGVYHLFPTSALDLNSIAIFQLPTNQELWVSNTTEGDATRVGIDVWIRSDAITDAKLNLTISNKLYSCDIPSQKCKENTATFIDGMSNIDLIKIDDELIDGRSYTLVRIWGWFPTASLK